MNDNIKQLFERYLAKSKDDKDMFHLEILTANIDFQQNGDGHIKGFATWRVVKNILFIGAVLGTAKYWNKFFLALADKMGCDKIMFVSYRNQDAGFEKLFEVKKIGEIYCKELVRKEE